MSHATTTINQQEINNPIPRPIAYYACNAAITALWNWHKKNGPSGHAEILEAIDWMVDYINSYPNNNFLDGEDRASCMNSLFTCLRFCEKNGYEFQLDIFRDDHSNTEHADGLDQADLPKYCTQNNGDCETCSLKNYNKDCRNNPLPESAADGGEEEAQEVVS